MRIKIKVKNTHRKRLNVIINEVGAQLRARCPDLQEAFNPGQAEAVTARLTKMSVSTAGKSLLFCYAATKHIEDKIKPACMSA